MSRGLQKSLQPDDLILEPSRLLGMEVIPEPHELSDDRQYEFAVLQLTNGRTESDLDDQYLSNAATLGVSLLKQSLEDEEDDGEGEEEQQGEDGPVAKPGHGSQETIESCNASSTTSWTLPRSTSSTSRQSCSTGITYPSRHSKEYRFQSGSPLPVRTPSHPSLNEKHHVAPSNRSSSLSFLPRSGTTTAAPSARSSILVSPSSTTSNRPLSVIGRLSRLSMFKKPSVSHQARTDTAGCRQCPFSDAQTTPSHHLLCDHSLCEKHLLELVTDVREKKTSRYPECCQYGISPQNLQVLRQKDPGRRRTMKPLPDTPHSDRPRTSPAASSRPPILPRGRTHRRNVGGPTRSEQLSRNLKHAMEFPEFRSLRKQQASERDRFLRFRDHREQQIRARFASKQDSLSEKHTEQLSTLTKSHPTDLAALEEKQLAAEMEMRDAHDLEQRNCLLALRHMEGYCRGHDPDGTGRVVTLEDRRKLDRQYSTWKGMEKRHESAINIMREQQGRQMKARTLKQLSEISQLQAVQAKESKEISDAMNVELRELETIFGRRKGRLIKRWNIATDTWRGWREKDDGVEMPYPIAPLDWPEVKPL